jgi:hypothetical protein
VRPGGIGLLTAMLSRLMFGDRDDMLKKRGWDFLQHRST